MEKNIINIDAHVIDDIRTIITRARNRAYQSINETLIRSNWEIGKRIVEEEQNTAHQVHISAVDNRVRLRLWCS